MQCIFGNQISSFCDKGHIQRLFSVILSFVIAPFRNGFNNGPACAVLPLYKDSLTHKTLHKTHLPKASEKTE